jgi:hypothetical protein
LKRGITFEIPNKYGSYLGDILKPIDMTAFTWRIGAEESYVVVVDQLEEPLFPEEINGMDGRKLKSMLENRCIILFLLI